METRIGERKVSATGSRALLFTLPKWWTVAQGIKSGDYLIVSLIGENGEALKIEKKSNGKEKNA